LSLLQSAPSAIEALTRHPQRRAPERKHFADTSPLLQATLKGASSPGEPPSRGLTGYCCVHLVTERMVAIACNCAM
jgi:hypothetical protein